MNIYHFAALTALMGLSFLSAGLATVLARQRVESWYQACNRPEKVPPPPAYGWLWSCAHLLMGAAAWLVWLSGPEWGAPWVRLGMILYFVMLGLNVLWSGLFFRMARPGAAFGAVLAEEVVTLAALIVFWNIGTLPGALLVPVLLWTGYIALRSLLWWRHGRQFRPVETEGAVPSPHLAA